MKSDNNKLVWQILTGDEQQSLTLSLGFNKSTWQAGELMNKAHYKYLEIQGRANKFFLMFSEYFTATGNERIPKDCILNKDFRDYILLTVFERVKARDAITQMEHTAFIIPTAKERILREGLQQLSSSPDPVHQLLYDLIIEFDRWNNNRILPITLQEPSAFKRRNKTRLIKHLKNLSNLDEYHITRFAKRFKAKGPGKVLYIPVISKSYEEGYNVIKIKDTEEVVEYISKHLRLYLFEKSIDAEQFGYLVNKYLKDNKKDCKVGQKFWPMYRQSIEIASNYLEVNNIIPRRKHLEQAFRDLDNIRIKGKNKNKKEIKTKMEPVKRAESQVFWSI